MDAANEEQQQQQMMYYQGIPNNGQQSDPYY